MNENFHSQAFQELDTEYHKGLRARMINELRECGSTTRNRQTDSTSGICKAGSGITYSTAVLEAMGSVPRHIFIAQGIRHMAYQDKPLPIVGKQTISQPSTVALQSSLLGNIKGEKVLEIGTGCGYQTAVLAQLGAKVYTIERQKELCRIANGNLKSLGYSNVTLCWGDGHKGLQQAAPFKAIIVTCAAQSIPEALLLQLEIGGKMVIPIGENNKPQQMFVITRQSESNFHRAQIGECSFVPMLEGVVESIESK